MDLKLITSAAFLAVIGLVGLASCGGEDKEEENATVVNVEKDVAPPMATPDAPITEPIQPDVDVIESEEPGEVEIEPVKEEKVSQPAPAPKNVVIEEENPEGN